MADQVLQVVDGTGQFNTEGVSQFIKDTGVEGSGVGYTVVAIMGPQSSGKSTLLNHLVRCRQAAGGRRRVAGGQQQCCRSALDCLPSCLCCAPPSCS